MASATATPISLSGLPKSKAVALQKKAERLGMTMQDYIKQLISDDLELDKQAAHKTFDELSAPFQKALAGLTEAELDAMARPNRRRTKR